MFGKTRFMFSWCNILSVNSPVTLVLHACKIGSGQKCNRHDGSAPSHTDWHVFDAVVSFNALTKYSTHGRGTLQTSGRVPRSQSRANVAQHRKKLGGTLMRINLAANAPRLHVLQKSQDCI